jgi:CubicO group peptidase (beta-lactamase class C family)
MSSEIGHITRRSVLKGGAAAVAAAALLNERGPLSAAAAAPAPSPGKLPRVSPEAVGVSPAALMAFLDAVDRNVGGLHGFLLLRHGKVVAEGWWAPYAPQYPHTLYSLSKSFTSTAVGLAVAEKRLAVEDRVVSFFPDKLPRKLDDNLAAMRVKHLLTMNTGHDKDATGPVTSAADGDWVRAFLSLPVEHLPGSKFVYNSAATYVLSAIVQQRTGMRLTDYLKPRLFDPLGIRGQTWETCPKGIDIGGWGLSVKTEDIARFGQLYLQKGRWNGRQLVPAAWVEEATSKQVSNGDPAKESDWTQGYGYQFWRSRHGAYRGDGAFGQYCVVLPEQDAVLAITSGVGDMQAVLNAAWDHLLPGMGAAAGLKGARAGSEAALRRRLASLAVPAPQGDATSATAARVSGKVYQFEPNAQKVRSVDFTFSPDRCTMTLRGEGGGARRIVSGHGSWTNGAAPAARRGGGLGDPPAGKSAARGAWTADATYTIKVCYVETPYVETIECRFSGDEGKDVAVSRKMNVSFGPTERPLLVGRAG